MPDTYDKIFRAVAIRANLLESSDIAAFEIAYTDPDIGQNEMLDRASQFPFSAVNDAILSAGDRLVGAIGSTRSNQWRKDFLDVTGQLSDGALVPKISSTGKPIVGVLGIVRDVSGNELEWVTREEVEAMRGVVLKQTPRFYFTDEVRIYHTGNTVSADVVIWSKSDQRVLLTSTPTRGLCPFSEDLHEALISGALVYLARGGFNAEQAPLWKQVFNEKLVEISAKTS